MLSRVLSFCFLVVVAYGLAAGQSAPIIVSPGSAADPTLPKSAPPPPPSGVPALKPGDLEKRHELSSNTKLLLIRLVNAELVHVRKNFPIAEKDMVIEPDGTVKPDDAQLYRSSQSYGTAARIGDRVQITNIVFHEKAIYLEINGGPKKKDKWYKHIEIMGAGGGAGGADPNQAQPTGGAVTVQFKKHVPEMDGAELKELLAPVLDFTIKTAAEVYAETLPPKVRAAVKNHEVLVGMNHDMVIMAKDRPQQKVREKDDKGKVYEDWIYGAAPQDVVFVRFVGDEVVMVKIAKVGGQMIVKTDKEVDVRDGVVTLAALKSSASPEDAKAQETQAQAQAAQQPTKRPTLKRPDEQTGPVFNPPGQNQQQPAQEEPQWGTDGKQPPPTDQQPASTQKPPQQ